MTTKSSTRAAAPVRAKVAAVTAGAAIAVTSAGVTVAVTGTPAQAQSALTITPNPRVESSGFQGWGTSLVWFANATGDYPDHLREELYEAVFGADGLDLNIARYNIGGQNASDIEDYLRAGGAVDGWWAEDPDGDLGVYGGAATDYASRATVREAFDPTDPAHIDADADPTQRWWVDKLVTDDQITHWEAFANSAPYFMTESGYVSGGFSSTQEQLRPDSIEAFSRYLVAVVDELETAHGMSFHSIDPLNEPNTNYWGTQLQGGVPVGGRQEGMHVGPARQAQLVTTLRGILDEGTGTSALVSAMDETNPGTFVTNWEGYGPEARAAVGQMNVHTYGTGGRLQVRDLAKQADKPLWMSEIEGSWVSGWNPLPIENGLGLAGRIHDDLRELEPEAWVLWQPIEDLYNMQPQGENLNWGSVFVDFDCTWFDEDGAQTFKSERRVADAGGDPSAVEECGIVYNSKFNTMRNFTHFIRPGASLIPTNDQATTAAIPAGGEGLTLVHSNASEAARVITVDLSGFETIAAGATATPHVTTEAPALDDPTANALVAGDSMLIDRVSKTATVTVPAKSVTSIVLTGVSGVSDEAPGLIDGHTYQLQGAHSGLMLDSASGRLTIEEAASDSTGATGQAWTAHAVAPGVRESIHRVVLVDGEGRVMGATNADTDLRSISVADAMDDPETRWIVNSSDGVRFSLVNESLARTLEVGGQATAPGSTVGWWTSSGGAHQLWTPRDLQPATTTVSLRTTAGVAPDLPSTVSTQYAWGAGAAVQVEWDLPDPSVWDTEGTVEVTGTATDVYGSPVEVIAVVDVGGLTVTNPRSITVFAGSTAADVLAAAPATVEAHVGASQQSFTIPVTWDGDGLDDADFAAPGVVAVPGVAVSDGSELTAVLHVIVAPAVDSNINPGPGTVASATSTESGYPVDRTRDGVRTDKGWSNWVASNKPAQDTLTYEYDRVHALTGAAVYFFPDGSHTSWAETLTFQYRDPDGTWHSIPGHENPIPSGPVVSPHGPVVIEEFDTPLVGDAFRIVLDAFDNTHMVVSEVEVYAAVAAAADESRLADLRVDGDTVPGFDGDTADYSVQVDGARYPIVSAHPVDENARVTVQQPDEATDGVATVRVWAADGSGPTVYTVEVDRAVSISSVQITGDAVALSSVTASVAVDPADASVTLAWLLDGEPLSHTGETLALTEDMIGAELSLEATASADGFIGPVTEISETVTINAPEGWSDATASSITVDGSTLDGFSSSTLAYDVTVVGSALPEIAAAATSPHAEVHVVQPTGSQPTATVTVTAGDGSQAIYTVEVLRQVGVDLALTGAARAGATVLADVATDPADAAVTYEWRIDGETVSTDGPELEIPITATGSSLSLSVAAVEAGFVTGSASVSGVAIGSPEGIDPVIELSVSRVTPGQSVVIDGSGLTPGGGVIVELHSTPVELSQATADAGGTFSVSVTIPVDTVAGEHRVVVTDATTGLIAQAPLTVVAATDGSGPGTGTGADDELSQSGASIAGLLALVTVMLAGGALLMARRRADVE